MPTDSDSRKLERIEAALSNLEISADSVNLNTDGLETKLDTANGILTTLSADTALLKDDVANGVGVTGTFWQATQPISGTVTAAQATAANLNATVVQGTATSLKTQAENYQGGSAVGSGNPLQVTLANTGANSTAILTTNRGATGEATVSNFTSTTSATLKSSNSSRKVLTIYNEGAGNLHVLYGSGTASTTNYSVKLFSGDYLEIDKYTGQVNAIFATAGTARVTEIT